MIASNHRKPQPRQPLKPLPGVALRYSPKESTQKTKTTPSTDTPNPPVGTRGPAPNFQFVRQSFQPTGSMAYGGPAERIPVPGGWGMAGPQAHPTATPWFANPGTPPQHQLYGHPQYGQPAPYGMPMHPSHMMTMPGQTFCAPVPMQQGMVLQPTAAWGQPPHMQHMAFTAQPIQNTGKGAPGTWVVPAWQDPTW